MAYGRSIIARHVIGCHLTQETWVQSVLVDVASSLRQDLPRRHSGQAAERIVQRRDLLEHDRLRGGCTGR